MTKIILFSAFIILILDCLLISEYIERRRLEKKIFILRNDKTALEQERYRHLCIIAKLNKRIKELEKHT